MTRGPGWNGSWTAAGLRCPSPVATDDARAGLERERDSGMPHRLGPDGWSRPVRCIAVAAALAVWSSFSVPPSAAEVADAREELAWSLELPGWNRSSSPVIADIDADGVNELVFGHQDGRLRAYEGDGKLKWARKLVPGYDPGGEKGQCVNAQRGPSAIDSSPAVADVDGDGRPEVIVGVGSTFAHAQHGTVFMVDGKTGRVEWSFEHSRDTGTHGGTVVTPVPDGWCEGTYSTPAIGDVDGDGELDIVFASWDFYIWAVDGEGRPLAGFPFNNDDTVWSSPALFDVDGDGDVEIFIGGDTTPGGYFDHLGGVFRAFDYRDGAPAELWNRTANEVFHSSPAIGDINGDGRMEAVVGMGDNWHIECTQRGNRQCSPGDGSDRVKVWAFHLDDGSDVKGWPVRAGDTVWASPALGDIDRDGKPEVVVGSYDGFVYAWNGDGSRAWRVKPDFAHPGMTNTKSTAHPIIADLDGDGDQDVVAGTAVGLALLDGRKGTNLEADLIWQYRRSVAWSHESAPAVGWLDGGRHLVFTAFDTPKSKTLVAAYRLPEVERPDAWPMFRHSATRQGTMSTSSCYHTAPASRFCDVPADAWYADAVKWMLEERLVTGGKGQRFRPSDRLTRADMVTYLWRQAGVPSVIGMPKHGFTDVRSDSYYERAVRWAKATGVTTGTSATSFSPHEYVTRAQFVTLLWRRAGSPSAPSGTAFSDVPAAGAHFSESVYWALSAGVTTGTTPTTFSPYKEVTREQTAAFLRREATR